jgi:hypothetical protein
MSLRYSEDSEAFDQAARDVLLKYYASKSTTHGEYARALCHNFFFKNPFKNPTTRSFCGNNQCLSLTNRLRMLFSKHWRIR